MRKKRSKAFGALGILVLLLLAGTGHPARAQFDPNGHYRLKGADWEEGALDILKVTDKKFKFQLQREVETPRKTLKASCLMQGTGYFYAGWSPEAIHGSSFYSEDSRCELRFVFDAESKVVKVKVGGFQCACVFERVFEREKTRPFASGRARREFCCDAANEILWTRYPDMERRTIADYRDDLAREREEIRQGIEECKSRRRSGRAVCDEKVDAVFEKKHPAAAGKRMYRYGRELEREWRAVYRDIEGCE